MPAAFRLGVGTASDHGQSPEHGRQQPAEAAVAFVEQLADRGVRPAHHALHSVGGTGEMAFIDRLLAACAHEEVLQVVGHADHLVGNHLADGNQERIAAVAERAVDLDRPIVADGASGGLPDEVRVQPAELHDVGSPIVGAE